MACWRVDIKTLGNVSHIFLVTNSKVEVFESFESHD